MARGRAPRGCCGSWSATTPRPSASTWSTCRRSSSAVCTVVDAAVLTADRPLLRSGTPLLVVTESVDVPAEVWSAALAAGARAVLPLPAGSDELLSRLSELARPRSSALLLGVVGGCGGAGTSSFAARLAAAARPHGSVTLIDADPLGGGADLLVEAPVLEGSVARGRRAGSGRCRGAARGPAPGGRGAPADRPGEDPGPERSRRSSRVLARHCHALGGTVIVDLEHGDWSTWRPTRGHQCGAGPRHRSCGALHGTTAAVLGTCPRIARAGGAAQRRARRPGRSARTWGCPSAASFRDSPRGTVPLLDVRRHGADRAARALMAQHEAGVRA